MGLFIFVRMLIKWKGAIGFTIFIELFCPVSNPVEHYLSDLKKRSPSV